MGVFIFRRRALWYVRAAAGSGHYDQKFILVLQQGDLATREGKVGWSLSPTIVFVCASVCYGRRRSSCWRYDTNILVAHIAASITVVPVAFVHG